MSSSSASPAAASRIRSVSPALASSPASGSSSAYLAPSATAASRSRHSLYGSEDYLILDLGSRIWKVGFSGESSPRAVFDVGAEQDLWDFANTSNCARLVKKWLRKVYYE
jgi:actin-related protein 10